MDDYCEIIYSKKELLPVGVTEVIKLEDDQMEERDTQESVEARIAKIPSAFRKYRNIVDDEDEELKLRAAMHTEAVKKIAKERRREERERRRSEREIKKERRSSERRARKHSSSSEKESRRKRREERRKERREKKKREGRRSDSDKEKKHDHSHRRRRYRRSEERKREDTTDIESVKMDIDENTVDDDYFVVDHRPSYGALLSNESRAFETQFVFEEAVHGIGRPEDLEQFAISSLLRGCRKLGLKPVEGTNLPTIGAPLGSAFDCVARLWIYTNTANGEIQVATYEGHMKDRITGFRDPSAIAIITPGSHFAVLDRDGITKIDILSNRKVVIADGFHGKFRGLATTNDGNLVTIKCWSSNSYDAQICIFSQHHNNLLIHSTFYSDTLQSACPSFICTKKEMIFVTDLDRNHLTIFGYSKEQQKIVSVAKRDFSHFSRYRCSSLRTKFISGIVADAQYGLLIADARGRTINYCSGNGSLIQTIPFSDNSHPYISGIALAPTGRLMACHRRTHQVVLYDLVPVESDEDVLARGIEGLPPMRRLY